MPSSADGDLVVTGTKHIEPSENVLDVLKQAYSIQASLADLVDNSIDAKAKQVLIRFQRRKDRLVSLCVVDDGEGISPAAIDQAMQFGSRRKYGRGDLGMFGVGMKTASLGQAGLVSVLSVAAGCEPVGRQWSERGIKERKWECAILQTDSVDKLLHRDWSYFPKLRSGTVIRWDQVHAFEMLHGSPDEFLQETQAKIRKHLGLKLHRFLEKETVEIILDVEDLETGELGPPTFVEPINPFPRKTGRKGYPKLFEVKVPGMGLLRMKAHIWPKRSTEPGYKLGGKVAQQQGFYFYRRDRLIQEGGWHGWRGTLDPHLSLARVEVDIPDELAPLLKVRSTKAGVDAALEFSRLVAQAKASDGTTFQQYVEAAEEVYRTRGPQKLRALVKPGDGVPSEVRTALERAGVPMLRGSGMRIRWGRFPGDHFFKVGRSARELTLNVKYRPVLLNGRRGGKADTPIVRTLLYFLLNSTFERVRGGELETERLQAIDTALRTAIKLEARRQQE